MQLFEYRSVRYWSKEINGTLTGGRKKYIFLIRDIDDAAMAGASVESCHRKIVRSAIIFSQGWRARAFAAFVILTTRLFSVVSGDCGSRRDAVPRHARAELKSADAC